MTEADRAAALAALFRTAQSAAIHPAGCLCGGMFRPTLDAAGLEADLLDYLAPRYAASGPPALAELVQARLDQPGGQRFEAWLRGLAKAPVDPAARALLFDELEALLTQMTEAARPGGRFACS